jgi:hypothetical protein
MSGVPPPRRHFYLEPFNRTVQTSRIQMPLLAPPSNTVKAMNRPSGVHAGDE